MRAEVVNSVFPCLSALSLSVGSCYKFYESAWLGWFVALVAATYCWAYMDGHVGVCGHVQVLSFPVGGCYKCYKSTWLGWFVALVAAAYGWAWYG